MDTTNKRKLMYLELNKEPSKRRLLSQNKIELLSSPDVQKLKLGSPELEKFIISNGNSGSLVTPTQVFFPKNVTEEQELYAKGFIDALDQLRNPNTSMTSSSDSSSCSQDFEQSSTIQVKQEQIVPNNNNSNVAPIDMESQEKIKLERKRQRNRIAASKCRKRKLERIAKLEDKVKLLKSENENLNSVLLKLKDSVGDLKGRVMEHIGRGCQIMLSEDI